jgi:hypothetical protein
MVWEWESALEWGLALDSESEWSSEKVMEMGMALVWEKQLAKVTELAWAWETGLA